MSGWIKLHRTLQAWGWKKSPYHTAVFIDLLLEASHKDNMYMGVMVPKGSLTTSIKAISQRSGVTEKRVRTVLTHLKRSNEVAITSTPKYTMISITKWDEYQGEGEVKGEQRANNGQTTGKQRATNKNVKNVKKVKNVKNKNTDSADDFDDLDSEAGKIMSSSPLAKLFKGHDREGEIMPWLISGELKAQQEIFEKYDSDYLVEVIEAAYSWKVENNKKRKAGRYIAGWIERDANRKYKGGVTEFQSKLQNFITENNLQKYVVEA